MWLQILHRNKEKMRTCGTQKLSLLLRYFTSKPTFFKPILIRCGSRNLQMNPESPESRELENVIININDNRIIIRLQLQVLYCCSVAQLCPTLCDPMDCRTPGFPVLHHLLELAQTHVHPVSDAIQPSHPLSSPSPPAFNLSQHQGLFQ